MKKFVMQGLPAFFKEMDEEFVKKNLKQKHLCESSGEVLDETSSRKMKLNKISKFSFLVLFFYLNEFKNIFSKNFSRNFCRIF